MTHQLVIGAPLIKANELSEKYVEAMQILGGLLEQQNEIQAALDIYKRAVNHDPYRESAQQGVMRSLVTLKRRTEALRYYNDLERFYQDELGVPPTPETASLYRRILRNESLAD